MRLYLPATTADLLDLLADPANRHAGPGSGVTPALAAALPEEDEEGLELSAFLTAADLAVLRIAGSGAPPCRVVLAVDLPQQAVTPFGSGSGSESAAGSGSESASGPGAGARTGPDAAALTPDPTALPSLVGTVEVGAEDLVAVHVDDPVGDLALVRAAVAGDEEAFDELVDLDLLWYDPSELDALRELLADL